MKWSSGQQDCGQKWYMPPPSLAPQNLPSDLLLLIFPQLAMKEGTELLTCPHGSHLLTMSIYTRSTCMGSKFLSCRTLRVSRAAIILKKTLSAFFLFCLLHTCDIPKTSDPDRVFTLYIPTGWSHSFSHLYVKDPQVYFCPLDNACEVWSL